MLKSIFLAGVLLVTSNFIPSPATVPTIVAANTGAIPVAASRMVDLVKPLPAPASVIRSINDQDGQMPAGLTSDEIEFVQRINAERTSRGLNALTVDPLLVDVARAHSREMFDKNYFDHHSPTPGITTPMDRYLAGLHAVNLPTPDYLLVGENIYYCSESTDTYNVAFAHRALMNSPGHRANILEPRFARIGVGIYRDSAGELWVTQMFLRDDPPEGAN
jgi:uncharacterized protein YkwD